MDKDSLARAGGHRPPPRRRNYRTGPVSVNPPAAPTPFPSEPPAASTIPPAVSPVPYSVAPEHPTPLPTSPVSSVPPPLPKRKPDTGAMHAINASDRGPSWLGQAQGPVTTEQTPAMPPSPPSPVTPAPPQVDSIPLDQTLPAGTVLPSSFLNTRSNHLPTPPQPTPPQLGRPTTHTRAKAPMAPPPYPVSPTATPPPSDAAAQFQAQQAPPQPTVPTTIRLTKLDIAMLYELCQITGQPVAQLVSQAIQHEHMALVRRPPQRTVV